MKSNLIVSIKALDIVLFMTISIKTSLVKLPIYAYVDKYFVSNEVLEKVFLDSSSLCLPNHLKCTTVSIYRNNLCLTNLFKNV